MRKMFFAFLILLLLTIISCNSKSSGPKPKSDTRFDFGRSTTVESLRASIANTLRKYNHDLQVSETFIETEYRYDLPTLDERTQGIQEVRYKLSVLLKARRNPTTAEARLQCEGRYQTGEWIKITPNPEMIELVKRMQNDIKQDLQRFLPQW